MKDYSAMHQLHLQQAWMLLCLLSVIVGSSIPPLPPLPFTFDNQSHSLEESWRYGPLSLLLSIRV